MDSAAFSNLQPQEFAGSGLQFRRESGVCGAWNDVEFFWRPQFGELLLQHLPGNDGGLGMGRRVLSDALAQGLFCLLAGLCGSQRRMGFFGTFFLSVVVTPVVVLLILILTAPSRAERDRPTQSN